MKLLKVSLTALLSLVALCAFSQEETLWGYFTGTDFKGTGYEYAGEYGVGLWVPGNATLAGKTIVALNVPCRSAHCTAVRLWGGTSLGDKSLLDQDCSATTFIQGYTRVNLSRPVTIPSTGMYIGYYFSIDAIQDIYDQNPVGCVRTDGAGATPAAKSFYLSFSAYGGQWEDKSDIRSSALQLFLTGGQSTSDYVLPTSVEMSPALAGQSTAPLTLRLASYSSRPVTSIDYTLEAGGHTASGTKTFSTPLASGLNVPATVSLDLNLPQTPGRYDATLTLTHINGQPNVSAAPTSFAFSFDVLSRAAKRLTVVEEVTGTGCSFCPKGIAVMNQVKKDHADKVAVITVHWFNNYSPMYVADYDQSAIPTSTAPLCMIDRKTPLFDPYDGLDGKSTTSCAAAFQSLLPLVDITAQACFADDTYSAIQATAATEFLTDLPGSRIAFVLTADGLTGASPLWKQANSFAEIEASRYPLLADFCAGGIYGTNPAAVVYDDVMIASSWLADNQEAAPAFTTSCTAGQRETLDYRLSLPAKEILRSAIHTDRLYLTVLVLTADGTIANAVRCPVADVPEGIASTTDGSARQRQSALPDGSLPGAKTTHDLFGRKVITPAPSSLLITKGKKHLVR